MEYEALVKAALDALKSSYSPYSGFAVGAALLTDDGRVFSGCNIENSSYSATVCAERTALFTAVAAGARKFSALAVVGGKGGAVGGVCPPCGVCLQALSEFCPPEMPVLLISTAGNELHRFSDFLPNAFRL